MGKVATAFLNLANSAGLLTRRILLLNATQGAKHVDAEVLLDGHSIVVDPGFHVILIVLFLIPVRSFLRRYGEKRLRV